MDNRRKWTVFSMVLMFLTGLLILLYPKIQGNAVDQELARKAQSFLQQTEPMPSETTQGFDDIPVSEPYPHLLEDMIRYNHTIWAEHQSGLCDPWAYEQPSFSLGDYGMENDIFGVIQIPSLSVQLPVYLGATSKHMNDGAAHLSQTSLPIGGDHTNCVIAAHNGWGGATYFRHLPELQAGDEVILTNPWESLRYVVTEKQIIEPNEINKILIQEGRELLTLLTCYPYGSGGRQRYIVYCERAD